MRKVLVTGGAGFIGSHLVEALLDRGDIVRVLDNFSTGRLENLTEELTESGSQFEILEGDICDLNCVNTAVQGVEVIFHQAAFISVPASMQDPQSCFDINVQGTLNLLNAAGSFGVQRVVIASSCAVYGDHGIGDKGGTPLRELDVLMPLSPYAASKQVAEIYAGLHTRAFDLEVVTLRYFNVHGPRQSPKSEYAAIIPIFIRSMLEGQPVIIFGDGYQRRDFVFVGDVVKANLLAAESSHAPGKVLNVCTGQATSLLELYELLSQIIPRVPPPRFAPHRPGDIFHSQGDPSLAKQTMDFYVRESLVEGLTDTMEWMRNNAFSFSC